MQEGHTIAYLSEKLNGTLNYPTYGKDLYGLVEYYKLDNTIFYVKNLLIYSDQEC